MLSSEHLRILRRTKVPGTNKLKLAMDLGSITQVELAAGVGISQSYVSRIANGEHPSLPLDTTHALAQFFGCQIEDLFPAPANSEIAS